MGVVKLADYRPQLEVVEHRVADSRCLAVIGRRNSLNRRTAQTGKSKPVTHHGGLSWPD